MKLSVNKKKACDLAERLGLNIGPRRNIMFRRFDRTGDYELGWVLKLQQHRAFLRCSSEPITLMHSTRAYNSEGIETSMQQFYKIPDKLLRELGMVEDDEVSK